MSVPSPFLAALSELYASDPHGDETLGALARAINANTAAVQAADARATQEREKQRLAIAHAAGHAADQEKEAQKRHEWDDAIKAF